jgi:predicted MPP superfamily phosphohydrolase
LNFELVKNLSVRKFAISDIHGCAKTFEALLNRIAFSKEDVLYLLGDYVDRGPDSKGVIDSILNLQTSGFSIHCLKGNHEEIMVKSKEDIEQFLPWLDWGGLQTLQSFGVYDLREIPQRYWDFLNDLENFFLADDYILVHAGLNFETKDPFSDEHAMRWQRDWYHQINYEWLKTRIMVHGHSQTTTDLIQMARLYLEENQVINIDNGCFSKNSPGRGNLCAFELTKRELFFQPNLDDMSSWQKTSAFL